MKDGYIKLTTTDFEIELPLFVSNPEKVIADCEQRFSMTSDDFMNTDKMLSLEQTMENAFHFIMWRAALNQRAGAGWELFGKDVAGSVVKFVLPTIERLAVSAQRFVDATSIDAATFAQAVEDGML